MEDVHRLLQLPARGRHRRREDLLLPRRPQPRPPVHGADQEDHEAHRRPRPGAPLRPTLVGPGQGTNTNAVEIASYRVHNVICTVLPIRSFRIFLKSFDKIPTGWRTGSAATYCQSKARNFQKKT